MRIAFIPSAYRTPFALELAVRLERAGDTVFWISPNRRWSRWLLERGVPAAKVLDITAYAEEWTRATGDTNAARSELNQIERKSRWRIYDLIASDHLLARRDTDYAIRYLAVCARRMREFLRANAIQMVSGELTWAFEQIAGQVCIELDLPFARPVDIRIPNDRTAFFSSRFETDLIELRATTDDDRKAAQEFLKSYRERPRKPGYAHINFSTLQANTDRIKLLARHVADLVGDPYDETSRRPPGLILNQSEQALRTFVRSRFAPFEMPDPEPKRPFVLMALHLQPEVTIDVMASPFCNQIENAQALARTLPVTHDLYVKEHGVALGRRAPGAYEALLAIPGVRLIDPRANTFALIQQAALVVTATGTVAYEASLLRRPAVTMGPTVFSPIVVSDHFNPFTDSVGDLLDRLAESPPRSDDEVVSFLAWLLAQTFDGVVGDSLWLPYTMEPDYIDKVADGFFLLFQKLEKSRQTGIR
jgi:hypothetical protein